MARVREHHDYEVTIGLQSKISMQFFSLSTIYPDITEKQVVNSIKQVIAEIGDTALFKYVYGRDCATLNIIEFDEFPPGITSSEQLKEIAPLVPKHIKKEIENERKRNS